MKTAIALAIGPLMLVSAYTLNGRNESREGSAFSAEIVGDVVARPSGDARFGVTPGAAGASGVFTISLGAHAEDGSVLFTRRNGEHPVPGTYRISNGAGADDIQALIMTGSATRPTGVFHGQSGTLVITSASEREIRGHFRIDATGFLAVEPDVENRPVKVSGTFTAAR